MTSMFYHEKWTIGIALASKHSISIVTREPARAIYMPSEQLGAHCGKYEHPSPRLWCCPVPQAPIWSMFYHWKWIIDITSDSNHSIDIVTSVPVIAQKHPIWGARSLLWTLRVSKSEVMVWDHPQCTYMKCVLPREMNYRDCIGLKTLHGHCH